MIIWRGWGLLVILFAIIGIAVTMPVASWIAWQSYPDNPNSMDLLRALQPLVFGLTFTVAGIIAGALSWFIGKRMNKGHDTHALFFVPVQWWSVVFGLIAVGSLASSLSPASGLEGAHSSFVSDCAKHEIGANTTKCECMASTIETGSDPMAYIPFYARMDNVWRSRNPDENAVQHFFEEYLPKISEEKRDAFTAAFDKATSCLDPTPTVPQTPAAST